MMPFNVLLSILPLLFIILLLLVVIKSMKTETVRKLMSRITISDRWQWLLVVVSLVPVGYWMYINRNVMKNGDRTDAVMFILGMVGISIPFAIIFGNIGANGLSSGIFNLIYGSGGRPEPKRYYKARTLLVQDKFNEAIGEFRKLLEEKPNDDYCQEQIGDIYADNIGNFRQAVEEYQKLLDMKISEKKTICVFNRLADIYSERFDDNAKAAGYLQEIVTRFHDSPDAGRAVARLKTMGYLSRMSS